MLRFAKLHLNRPQDFWNNVSWTNETKMDVSGHNALQHVKQKKFKTADRHKPLIATVQHGDVGVTRVPCSH